MISKTELLEVKGGFGKWIGIGAILTFIVGLVDGYLRPLKCN